MAMSGKAVAEKKFDAILRRMLLTKPLSRAEISAKIQDATQGHARAEVVGYFRVEVRTQPASCTVMVFD